MGMTNLTHPERTQLKYNGLLSDVAHVDVLPVALNNEAIKAVNAAGTGTVDLLKANASNQVELPTDTLFSTDKKVLFRDTGLYINSGADGKMTISSDGSGADDITLSGTVTVADTLTMAAGKAIALAAGGFTMANIARTATAAGDGTGAIAAGPKVQFVAVTCDNADKIITLPTPAVGDIVFLMNGATGYEIRTTSPTTIAINGGVQANAESAIAASTLVMLVCTSATTWVGSQWGTNGALTAVQVAAT